MVLTADLIFPQLFKNVNFRKMIVLAISAVFITAGILLWTTRLMLPAVFLLAMGTWGVYYEFLYFGLSQFVAKVAPVTARSGVWSVISVCKSIAYCFGPLISGWLYLWKGSVIVIFTYALLALMAYLVWTTIEMRSVSTRGEEREELEKFNIIEEIKYWSVLSEHVWPILLTSLTLGVVDAAFWTTGVVLSDRLVKENWIGGLFVSAYMVPSIFIGFMVARLGIFKGKKKLAEIFMLLTGIFTMALGWNHSVYLLIFFALMIGITTSVAWPLLGGVYSDIASRMGREQKHISGIAGSTVNFSYIIGPVVTGFLASKIGETGALMYLGIGVVLVSIFLLMVTPKKLKLPQVEISTWG